MLETLKVDNNKIRKVLFVSLTSTIGNSYALLRKMFRKWAYHSKFSGT